MWTAVSRRQRCRPGRAQAGVVAPRLLADLLDLVLPADCAGCAAPATPWCPRCAASAGPPRVVAGAAGTPTTVAAGTYAGPLRQALLAYKERGRRALVDPLADLMADAAGLLGHPRPSWPSGPSGLARCWLVPVPSRPGAARARGGDHLRALTDAVAERLALGGGRTGTGRPGSGRASTDRTRPQRTDAEDASPGWASVGVAAAVGMRAGGRDSVGLDAAARWANLHGRLFTRTEQLPPSGVTVLLVDDVVTTGATIRGSAAALAAVGVIVDGALTLCDASGAHGRPRWSAVRPAV
jgi:predicted amidophosphoribosyltransferase